VAEALTQPAALGGTPPVTLRHATRGRSVREASPGTRVWLPGGVHLLVTEGSQVRVLDPVPDGALSLEHTP
jgi:hypothetical protein